MVSSVTYQNLLKMFRTSSNDLISKPCNNIYLIKITSMIQYNGQKAIRSSCHSVVGTTYSYELRKSLHFHIQNYKSAKKIQEFWHLDKILERYLGPIINGIFKLSLVKGSFRGFQQLSSICRRACNLLHVWKTILVVFISCSF